MVEAAAFDMPSTSCFFFGNRLTTSELQTTSIDFDWNGR